MRRRILALAIAALLIPVFPQRAPGQTEPGNSAKPVLEGSFVPIGGIEQWITIKGDDRDNPVVLFLHGGPGDAESGYADALYAGWEKTFTLVQWDQRGAGRTYGKNGPTGASAMTVERMADDGIEVAQYLIQHLHKNKIIIVGTSWGSVLGIYMAHLRPDLFYAYVGVAQVVNWRKQDAAGYARVLELARNAGDQQAVAALTAIGPPPWSSISAWPKYKKWERIYQKNITTAPTADYTLSPAYASDQEQAQYDAADEFSFEHFWGLKMDGPVQAVDLPSLGTDFAIPIFIVQGEEDLTAAPELAEAYYDGITAPHKEFFLVPGTGHTPSTAELDLVRKILGQIVRTDEP